MSENKKCRDCKYLSVERHVIGRRCVNPNKDFLTDLSMFKDGGTYACKLFEQKTGKGTQIVRNESMFFENTPLGRKMADGYAEELKEVGYFKGRADYSDLIAIYSAYIENIPTEGDE